MTERITQANHYGKTGGPAHRSFVRQIAILLEDSVARTTLEYPVFDGGKYVGAIDLLLSNHHIRVAVEVEFSADRVLHDVTKARLARVDQLIICVPNAKVRQAVRRKLARYGEGIKTPRRIILTLSQTINQLTVAFTPANRTESQVLGSGEVVSEGSKERCVRAGSNE